jgi:hypothetical protein
MVQKKVFEYFYLKIYINVDNLIADYNTAVYLEDDIY